MPQVRNSPQMRMAEEVLMNDTLLAALEAREDHKESAKEFRRAMKDIKELMPSEPGLYRCGPFSLEIKERTGGGFEVKAWKTLVARISPVE